MPYLVTYELVFLQPCSSCPKTQAKQIRKCFSEVSCSSPLQSYSAHSLDEVIKGSPGCWIQQDLIGFIDQSELGG